MEKNLPHILGSFETALQELRSNVIRMASLSSANLETAMRGLTSGDPGILNEVIADDDEVNQLERGVDREGMEILFRFSPVASDLRDVLAGMKIAGNIERISDQAKSIARKAKKVLKQPAVPELALVQTLAEAATAMLSKAVSAYVDRDAERGLAVVVSDRDLDKLYRKAYKELTKAVESSPQNAKAYIHMVVILRALERVGDLAVNIAEDTVFAERATDIRHLDLDEAVKVTGLEAAI